MHAIARSVTLIAHASQVTVGLSAYLYTKAIYPIYIDNYK